MKRLQARSGDRGVILMVLDRDAKIARMSVLKAAVELAINDKEISFKDTDIIIETAEKLLKWVTGE